MLIKAPKNMTVRNLLILLKYDDIDILVDRRRQEIWLEGNSSYANEKLSEILERGIPNERYNNGG